MRIKLIRHRAAGDGAYRSTEHGIWYPGEERDVLPEKGIELIEDFPGAFSVVQEAPAYKPAKKAAEKPEAPAKPKRRSYSRKG